LIGAHPAEWFGSGRGRLKTSAPITRLLAWVLLTAACLLLRPSIWHELLTATALLIVWLSLTRPPRKGVFKLLGVGLIFFVPVFILLPWTGRSEQMIDLWGVVSVRSDAWVAPANVLVRGIFCLLLGYGLIASLEKSEFQQALVRLPLPRVIVVMVHQILRWLGPIVEESTSIGRAVALRGGTRGFKTGLRLTRALPTAWLPRVLSRADRVSAAMQVRDYRGELMDPGPWRPKAADAWTLLLSLLLLGGVVVMLCLR
jgi:cobalt/nickel transport system permease protein